MTTTIRSVAAELGYVAEKLRLAEARLALAEAVVDAAEADCGCDMNCKCEVRTTLVAYRAAEEAT